MGFIPARCTQCGAEIEVDDTKEAGICKYCGTAFVTEKAINNYNTYITNNFDGANINIIKQGNPDYQCPKCKSDDIKALKLIQKKPTYVSYKTRYITFFTIGGLMGINTLLTIVMASSDPNMSGAFAGIGTITAIFVGLGLIYKNKHEENYNNCLKRLDVWKKGYKCMRCGEQFFLEDNKENN